MVFGKNQGGGVPDWQWNWARGAVMAAGRGPVPSLRAKAGRRALMWLVADTAHGPVFAVGAGRASLPVPAAPEGCWLAVESRAGWLEEALGSGVVPRLAATGAVCRPLPAEALVMWLAFKQRLAARRRLRMAAAAWELLDVLAEQLLPPPRPMRDDLVERTLRELGAWLDRRLDLRALAAAVGCAPSHLSRRFRQQTGRTLSSFHRELRLARAWHLLKSEGRTVTEAAYETGFSSLSHFSCSFFQAFGILPAKLRVAAVRERSLKSYSGKVGVEAVNSTFG